MVQEVTQYKNYNNLCWRRNEIINIHVTIVHTNVHSLLAEIPIIIYVKDIISSSNVIMIRGIATLVSFLLPSTVDSDC